MPLKQIQLLKMNVIGIFGTPDHYSCIGQFNSACPSFVYVRYVKEVMLLG